MRRPNLRWYLLLLALALLPPTASAQTRRALLVGINRYLPRPAAPVAPSERTRLRLAALEGKPGRRSVTPLEGAVNDVNRMRDLLARKFHLAPENIRVLTDEQATADNILEQLSSFLIDRAAPGDESLFFYAGHGSRIRNRATENPSGLDSTLIPADSALGVPDIRSKELAAIYLRAPRKRVRLTVIQDSCFSGGGARGPFPTGKLRVQPSDGDLAVNERPVGRAEEEGVLVLSASQDYQPAQEIVTENGSHGAFSWALLTALEQSSENERVDRIFQRARALMQSKVNDQEPVAGQSAGRNQLGLFGQRADPQARSSVTAVAFVHQEKAMIELNSGAALGLHPGCELKRVSPLLPEVRIRISEVNGPASSNAAIIAGEVSQVQPGQLFQIDRLAVPDQDFLKLFIGPAVSAAEVKGAAALAAELRRQPAVALIDDASQLTPTHVLRRGAREWQLLDNTTRTVIFTTPALPTAAQIRRALAGRKSRVAILLPPSSAVSAALADSPRDAAVAFVETPQAADYVLIGRAAGAQIEYAWVRPNETAEDLGTPQLTSPPAWPLRSQWTAETPKLRAAIAGLARIGGWIRLQTPADEAAFPYDIAFRTGRGTLTAQEAVPGGRYQLLLRRRAGPPATVSAPRRLYVFAIDPFGEGVLLFPPAGNLGNEFPSGRDEQGGFTLPDEILLTRESELVVGKPYGIDNYFVLATAQAIDNPEEVFNFEGVRTRRAGHLDPLARLVEQRAAGTRGALSGVPTDWSIERFAVRSVEPPKQ